MQPIFKVEADGVDVTTRFTPYLVELSVRDSSGFDSDTLEIRLSNVGGIIAPIRRGVVLKAWLGQRVAGIETLYFKGSYYVDECNESGAPDELSIHAKSADMMGEGKVLRTQVYQSTTLGAVLEAVAGRNGWQVAVGATYRSIVIGWLSQQDESDLAFITRLGSAYGAVATVKDSRLVFVQQGALQTQSGQSMPQITVNYRDCSQWSYQELGRGEYSGATANWRDDEGNTGTVTRGNSPIWVLRELFDSADRATEAADEELRRLAGGSNTLSLTLASANPALTAEAEILARGFRTHIDGQRWVAKDCTLTLGSSGFSGSVECERYV